MIEADVCIRVQDGLIVPMAVVEQLPAARAMLANVRHVREFVRNVRTLSFDPYDA